MTDTLVKRAFDALNTLADDERERIAYEILQRVEDKSEWDRLIADPNAKTWLEVHARQALEAYGKMQKKSSYAFVSVVPEHLQREADYWTGFDDLPEDIRRLAEKNYQLWRTEPGHPSLRFKQIHPELPIVSFRVAMNHRTVGVRTEDDRVAWFWVGSLDGFAETIKSS